MHATQKPKVLPYSNMQSLMYGNFKGRNEFEMSFTKNKRSSILINLTDDLLRQHDVHAETMCNLVKLTNVIFAVGELHSHT